MGNGKRAAAEDVPAQRTGAWLLWVQNLKRATFEPPVPATRILCSQDCPVIATQESLAPMQERHPKDNWAANLADLPVAAQIAPFQVTKREVLDAMRSFPAGSSGGGRTVCDPNFYSTCSAIANHLKLPFRR